MPTSTTPFIPQDLAASISSHQPSPAPTTVKAGSKADKLANILGIETLIRDRSDTSLAMGYKKYKACLDAWNKVGCLLKDGNWEGPKPLLNDVVEVFMSKTSYYNHRGAYSKLSGHPKMVEWLESVEGRPSDLEVWGINKPYYTIQDLNDWIRHGGTLDVETSEEMDRKKEKERKGKLDDVKMKKGKERESDKGKEKESGGSKSHKRKSRK